MKKITALLTILCVSALNGMEQSRMQTAEEKAAYFESMLKTMLKEEETQQAEKKRKKLAIEKERKLLFDIERQKTAGERKALLEILQSLPSELQKEVITNALLASKDLDETIAVIEAASIVGLQYNNLTNFTHLVHILANKFKKSTEAITKKFEMPTAKKYLQLNNDLLQLLLSNDHSHEAVIKLINKGADINFSNAADPSRFNVTGSEKRGPLHLAVSTNNIEIVKLLLNLGAKPNWADQGINEEKIVQLNYAEDNMPSTPKYQQKYRQLLHDLKTAGQIKLILKEAIQKK